MTNCNHTRLIALIKAKITSLEESVQKWNGRLQTGTADVYGQTIGTQAVGEGRAQLRAFQWVLKELEKE